MPKLKDIEISHKVGANEQTAELAIHVDAKGLFYCYIPDSFVEQIFDTTGLIINEYRSLFHQIGNRGGRIKVFHKEMDKLVLGVRKVFEDSFSFEEIVEHVIRYNIESHVSFAMDGDKIYPNCCFSKNSQWTDGLGPKSMYGGHHAQRPSRNGYSLTVGAKALTKTTIISGGKTEVTYTRYYKDGSHHGRENPAELLNSWASMSLDDNCREMPYSDEAALFFHELTMRMAALSKLIQENTFEPLALENAIKSHSNGIPLLSNTLNENREKE